MSRTSSRQGLLISAALIGLLLLALDLLRPDSLLRSAWDQLTPDRQTEVERGLEEFRRTRGGSLRR